MRLKPELSNLGQRLGEFAAQFEEKARSQAGREDPARAASILRSVWQSLKDLFTQGVTGEGLRNLYQREAQETLRFFTREIDFAALRPLPWYLRYPKTCWLIFLAMAYRLSPPRRLAFAIAAFAFVMGWLRLLGGQSNAAWWFLALLIFLLLLLMELRDKLDLKGDLEVAREIQFGLVPATPFHQEAMRIDCHMRPANTVGGDYYDLIELEGPHQVAIVVGDVAGKGMPAALLMALLQGSLRTLISAGLHGTELLAKLNSYLCTTIPSNSLITLFYGELDTWTGDLRFINAGHNAPFLLRQKGASERLHSTSVVLGVVKDCPFKSGQARLDAGDRLLVFTDGVSEAFNAHLEEYGETRLAEFLRDHLDLRQDQLIEGLIAEVLNFCGSVKPSDDMTLMLVSRASS